MKEANDLLNMTTAPQLSRRERIRSRSWLRNETGIVLVLFILATAIWLPRLSGPIDLRWDAGVYYILGTSLADGRGYRLLNEPGDIEAIQYPPLLPAIIAAYQWILGTSDPTVVGDRLRLSYFLMFNLYIFAIYLLLKLHLPIKYAFLATLVCLFNFYGYFLSDLCIPDIPFALTTTLFFLCNANRGTRLSQILAGVFAVASFALRTVGTALFAAWIAESIFQREFKRAAGRLVLAMIPILLWQSFIYFVESGSRYEKPAYDYQRADYLFYNVSYTKNIFSRTDPSRPESSPATFANMRERFLINLTEIPTALGEALSSKKVFFEMLRTWANKKLSISVFPAWVGNFLLIMLGCLILGGIGFQLIRQQWIIPLYILLSLAAICLTPWPEHFGRYLAALAPLLSLSLFYTLLSFQDHSYKVQSARWNFAGSAFAGAILSLIFLLEAVTLFKIYTKWHQEVVYHDRNGQKIVYRLFFYHDAYRALDAGLDWLKRGAKPNDVVAAAMPHWVYLRTGLKAVMPPFEENKMQLLDSVPVSYLILEEITVNTRKYALPTIQNHPSRWKRVYSDSFVSESGEELKDRFEIYQLVNARIPPS